MKRQWNKEMAMTLAMAIIAASLLGCSPTSGSSISSTGSSGASSVNQAVVINQATLARAQRVISSIDYLPFYNYDTGCETRAQWMGLELAANDLVGNVVTVTPHRGTTIWPKKLAPTRVPASPLGDEGSSWIYHVAMSFNVSGTEMVIDPSLSATAITQKQWLALLGTTEANVYIVYSAATGWDKRGSNDSRVGSLAKMPPLAETTMLSLAGMMLYKDLQEQEGANWTAADKAEAKREHDKLFDRAIALREILVKKGIITPAAANEYGISSDNLEQAEEDAPESD